MASISKHNAGYRAQVYVKGVRESRIFRTKREADVWAAQRETELRDDAQKPNVRFTLSDALERYVEEKSVEKRGERWERIRKDAMLRDENLPLTVPIGRVTTEQMNAWRKARMQQVSAGTVLREISFLSAVFEAARRSWKWIAENPIHDMDKPRAPDHREVIITRAQICVMLRTLGYSPLRPIRSVSQSIAVCFLVALRTGMRAGELCGLTWERVFDGYCRLPVTKTVPRDVPLTGKAMRLLEKMRGFDDLVFGLQVQTLDALFRKARNKAGLSGFTFHDSRHTAATWIAQSLDILDLCKMFGWKNPKQAMTYYNPKAADIAKRIK